MKNRNELAKLERRIYYPTDSIEYYDPKTGRWYNGLGQLLKDPDEYNPNNESLFGDE